MLENFSNTAGPSTPYADPEDSELVAEAKTVVQDPETYTFTEKDLIVYNLSVGATEEELHWVWENDEDFAPLPVFGIIPQFQASSGIPLDWLPDYDPVSLRFVLCDDAVVTEVLFPSDQDSPRRAIPCDQGSVSCGR